jgi:serine/threonine protein kinase
MVDSLARREPIEPRGDGPAWATGMVLQDTYTLGARIGQGGMGEVYEAAHIRLPGRFAVKILRPALLNDREAFKRFSREAEIMSTLRHPHIVQIFDFNTSRDGLPYFVMEYLEGVDLETRLVHTQTLPLDAAVRIVDAAASALSAAHALGIVHRDLKPANIFLLRGDGTDRDFVKVLDFGISRIMASGPRLSRESVLMGTPAFMAPEQALGLTNQIDGRTDQFALAAITYAMLTGRAPFLGDDPVSLLYQVVHEQPPPLSGFLSWDTTGIQAVLDRALAKRHEDRFEGIVAFASALGAAAESLICAAAPADIALRRQAPLTTPPPVRIRSAEAPSSSANLPALEERQPPSRRLPLESPRARPVKSVDRVPHGPQRAVVLGLAVLGLAAVIFHNGWYRGLGARAAISEQALAGLARGTLRTRSPSPSAGSLAVPPVTAAQLVAAPGVSAGGLTERRRLSGP